MASPFTIFRRYQKILLAVVGIGAMVAFVFLDPLTRYIGRNVEQQNPVVVETKYGALKQSEIDALRASRELVDMFIRRVAEQTVFAQAQQGAIDPRSQGQMAEQWYQFWHAQIMNRTKQGPEEAAVETMILAKKAEELGMVVSDRAVNEILKQISADTLSDENLVAIVNSLKMGRKVTVSRLFDAMRAEILASKYSEIFQRSLSDVPPAERFEYYSRMNRRAKAEMAPLAVADFVAQVADPKAEEVQAFYDKYKDRYPDKYSPEPGFKQPKRAAFQYFKADFEQFRERAKEKVTEAEIREYYEANKAQFRAIEPPAEQGATPDQPAAEASPDKPAEDKPAEDKPAEDKPAEEKAPEGEKPAEEKPAAEETPKTEEPAAEQPAAEKPTEEKPADPNPAAEAPKPEQAAAADAATPSRQRGSMRLVSTVLTDTVLTGAVLTGTVLTGADEATPAEAAPAADKPAADKPAAEQPAEEKPAAETPAADAPAATPSGDKPADATPAATDKPAETPAAETPATQTPAETPAAEVKYEPLEKVQDTIRDTLASQAASKQIGEIFDELSALMRRYSDDLDVYNAAVQSNAPAKAPEPFPLAELAKQKGIEAKELPLVTAAEAEETDLGKVRRFIPDARTRRLRSEAFVEFAYPETLPTFRPNVVQDTDGNAYLFWKTKEEAAYVPPLDQIREQVVRAWKMIKARDLARKRAEELAAQVKALQKPLSEVFADKTDMKVVSIGPFSWLTIGNVPFDAGGSAPRISEVEGVDSVGAGFMKTVFSLPPGGVGVAMNHPETMVYVVQVTEFEPPMDELRRDFAVQNPARYMAALSPERRATYTAWLDDMYQQANVKWLRAADLPANQRRYASEQPAEESMDF